MKTGERSPKPFFHRFNHPILCGFMPLAVLISSFRISRPFTHFRAMSHALHRFTLQRSTSGINRLADWQFWAADEYLSRRSAPGRIQPEEAMVFDQLEADRPSDQAAVPRSRPPPACPGSQLQPQQLRDPLGPVAEQTRLGGDTGAGARR